MSCQRCHRLICQCPPPIIVDSSDLIEQQERRIKKLEQQRDELLALVPQRTAGGFVTFGKYYAEQERVFAPPHDSMAKFKHKYLDQCEAVIAKVKP